MQFVLNINTDNAAFGENTDEETRRGLMNGECLMETARILRAVAASVEAGDVGVGFSRSVRDINGNDVGRAAFKR